MTMVLDTVLDKDLRDDMLKLVRYKILFVKREYEHAFPEKEDLVSDNMDGAAFTAWKVAEFIQSLQGHGDPVKVPAKWDEKGYPEHPFSNGGNLTGLPDWDKKYLRVYYEVLERYPREKFKYEEQQIKVLEQIRDRMSSAPPSPAPPAAASAAPPPPATAAPAAGASAPVAPGVLAALPDPYASFANYIQLSAPVFTKWRKDFAKCADGMSKSLAAIFKEYRTIGHITPPEITEAELFEALSQTKPTFNRASFDRFTGKTLDNLVLYAPQGEPPTTAAPPGYSWWGETTEDNGNFYQKITGSNYQHNNPADSAALWVAMSKVQADMIYNAYVPDVGIVSWSMYRENHDNQLRSIGYEVNGKLLWINEMLNPDGTKTTGPLPNVVPTQVVTPNQLIISIDFLLQEGKDTYFCVYALHIDLDFAKCSAKFAGRILELKSHLLTT
jgi:hypothetical protein